MAKRHHYAPKTSQHYDIHRDSWASPQGGWPTFCKLCGKRDDKCECEQLVDQVREINEITPLEISFDNDGLGKIEVINDHG